MFLATAAASVILFAFWNAAWPAHGWRNEHSLGWMPSNPLFLQGEGTQCFVQGIIGSCSKVVRIGKLCESFFYLFVNMYSMRVSLFGSDHAVSF